MTTAIEHKEQQLWQGEEIAGEQRAREEDDMFFDTMKQDKAEPPTTYEISSEPTQTGTQPQTQQTSAPLEDVLADQDLYVD